MKVVVIGGTGFVGSRIVDTIRASGHDALPASPQTGVDTLTGIGLDHALDGADVIVDASNAPPSINPATFFESSTRTLLAAATRAEVSHIVVVSIVGVDRLGDTPYFRGKQTQERLVQESGLPFSIVRSTQFLEFLGSIADAATDDGVVRLPPIFVRPIAVVDAAAAIATVALGEPTNAIVDVAGPTTFRLDLIVAETLAAAKDSRRVLADTSATYFGARISEDSLLPAQTA